MSVRQSGTMDVGRSSFRPAEALAIGLSARWRNNLRRRRLTRYDEPYPIEVPTQIGADEPLSTPQAERKLVTLLGCTLAAGGADLDALHRQMRILYDRVAEEVQRYGGTIDAVAGTRLLATFGAPIALENHARLALLAALQLQERFAAPCGDLSEESMSACLALHTGLVIVGEIGDGRPSTIVGNLTVAVEALQEHRLPGVLLCSEATARLIRDDVRLEEVAPVSISGEPGSIRTYKVTGPCLRDPARIGGRAHAQSVRRTRTRAQGAACHP